jgi:hypothetical protein
LVYQESVEAPPSEVCPVVATPPISTPSVTSPPVEAPVETPAEAPVEVTAPPTEQEIGTDICACQPGSYDIALDFAMVCDDKNIVEGPGITEVACVVEPPNVDDPVIVEASEIQIVELDQNLEFIEESQITITDTFVNGDTVTYESFIASDPGSLLPSSIPAGLQLSVNGVNADGIELTNLWVVLFTNDCDSYPVIENGEQIGWTIFVSARTLNLAQSPTQ